MTAASDAARDAAIELLGRGETLRFRAEGHSMWPIIQSGATVTVEPCDARACRVGDVVLVLAQGVLVLHRVIELRGAAGVVTKGDAIPRDDGLVPLGAIHGRLRRRPWDAVAAHASRRGGASLARALVVSRRLLVSRSRRRSSRSWR